MLRDTIKGTFVLYMMLYNVLEVVYRVRDLESVVRTSELDRRSFLRLFVARQIIWSSANCGSVFSGALLVSSTPDGRPEFIPSGCFRHAVVARS